MTMSPLSQLGAAISPGGTIDRKFSPLFNFIDEFDRHFSHHHRFTHCFNPRFDLEEDINAYYIVGEIPGATKDDILIEAGHDGRTLVVKGSVSSHLKGQLPKDKSVNGSDGSHVEILEGGKGYVDWDLHSESRETLDDEQMSGGNGDKMERSSAQNGSKLIPEMRRVLIKERLTGQFHRTFSFPRFVVEEGIKASVDNGLVYLVVPKKGVVEGKRLGRKIAVQAGGLESLGAFTG